MRRPTINGVGKKSLRQKWRLSTYALKLDVEEAEARLEARIDALEQRLADLEARSTG